MTRSNQGVAQLSKYGATGVLNTAIDFGVLNLLSWLFNSTSGVGLLLCNACAFGCANLNSYFWNKYWTFGDRSRPSFGQYGVFLTVSLGGLILNSLAIYLLVEVYAPGGLQGSWAWMNVAKVLATLTNMVWNFCMYRWVVFRLEPLDEC